ncbi:MAG: peptide chain release factor 2 [Candidatus Neomarinimicrobiota bacterium]
MEISEIKEVFIGANQKYSSLGGIFDLESLNVNLNNLKSKTSSPTFWDDNLKASAVLKKISRIEKEIDTWDGIDENRNDIEVLFEFHAEGEIPIEDLIFEVDRFNKTIEDLELKMILGKEEDSQDAIMTIHPGAGGTESQDWVQMLYRMYGRWAEKKGFNFSIIDFQAGDEAGIKEVTFEVKGEYAYGLAKAEFGVHRMVRISPFDSNSRRHTSFASVYVYPSADESIEIDINPSDLRIDTYRASGAGGQHVNKTDSAVRITHLPTNIVAQCQNERSQHKNKNQAMKLLKARLYQLEIDKEKERQKDLEDKKKDIAWGSQIRSYVFHPYNLVKDHRTKEETGNIQATMDGDLDTFIRSYLLRQMDQVRL